MVSKLKEVLLFLIIFFLLAFSISALTLQGQQMGKIVYMPGEKITNHYTISGTTRPTEVILGTGEFTGYISVSEIVNNEFDLIISFPQKLIDPGDYSFHLMIKEKADEITGITSLLSVNKRFRLIAYSREKDVVVSFSAASVNQGTPVKFSLGIDSQTYSDIDSVKGVVFVYDRDNRSLAILETKEKSLSALDSISFVTFFNTTNLPYDDYWAKAVVMYDGQEKEVTTSFKIGEMDIILENYTKTIKQGFSEFSLNVANNWGDELKNVYAKLFIDRQELLQTPSITLPPWGKGILEGIFEVDLAPGQYQGLVQIFFEGESKEEQIMITVVEPVEEPKVKKTSEVVIPYLIFLIALVVIVGIILIIVMNKRKNETF